MDCKAELFGDQGVCVFARVKTTLYPSNNPHDRTFNCTQDAAGLFLRSWDVGIPRISAHVDYDRKEKKKAEQQQIRLQQLGSCPSTRSSENILAESKSNGVILSYTGWRY